MNKLQNFFKLPFREDIFFGITALLFLLIPLFFTFYTYENYETVKFALWLFLFGGLLLLLLKQKKEIFFDAKYFIITALFLISALIATLFAIDNLHSVFGFYYRFTNGFVFFLLWGLTFLWFLQIREEKKREVLLKIFCIDALVIAILGILQSFQIGYYESLNSGGLVRSPSLLGNPNFSSMFVVICLPFFGAFFWKAENFKKKLFFFVASLVLVAALAFFSSRAAIMALVAEIFFSIIFIFTLSSNKKLKKIVLTFSLVVILLLFLILKITRPEAFFGMNGFSDANISLRMSVWEVSVKNLIHSPFVGFGLGNFQIFFENFRPQYMAGELGVFDDAHNLFIQMALTGGILLLLSFLSFFVLAFVRGVRELQKQADPIIFSSLLALIGFIIAASFNPVTLACFFVLGWVFSNFYQNDKKTSFNLKNWQKLPLGFLSILFIYFGFSLIISEHLFAYAYRSFVREKNFVNARIFSKVALVMNPTNSLYYLYFAGSGIQVGDFNENQSKRNIQTLKNLHSSSAGDNVRVANLYYLLAKKTRKMEYLNLAINEINESLEKDPYFGQGYGKLAFYYFLTGNLSEALKNLKISVIYEPGHVPSWVLMAKIYQLQNQKSQMLYALNKAYSVNPLIPQLKLALKVAKESVDIKKIPLEVLVLEGKID